MTKKLLILLLLALPFFVSAQEDPAIVKDFYESLRDVPTSIVVNDHLNVMQANIDNDNFEVIGVNDQMQTTWRASLKGYAKGIYKFKNKIVAFACTEYSSFTKNNNTYQAFLIDPSNGKVLIEKEIYKGTEDYLGYAQIFNGEGDGNYLKFAYRQSLFTKKLHVSVGGLFMTKFLHQMDEAGELEVMDLDDNLNPVNRFKPPIQKGTFINWTCNRKGDLFIGWFNIPQIDIYKYDLGQTSPSNQLTADVLLKEDKSVTLANCILLAPSSANTNILYYSLFYKNNDKEIELGVGKFDFSNSQKNFVTELFTKAHAKDLQKSFVQVNKKFDDPDITPVSGLGVRAMREVNGNVILTITSRSASSSAITSAGAWISEGAILFNNYNADLRLKSQQFVPCGYTIPNHILPYSFHYNKDKMFVITNSKGVFGILDLKTGNWEKMEMLSKKKVSNPAFAAGQSTLWFGNSYVVPYLDRKGLSQNKFDVTLQQNFY
jgi:hypothetical protein